MSGCAGGEPFALRVIGDSMSPEFEDGNIIIVEQDNTLQDGCFVVARHGDEYLLRKLVMEGPRWHLTALNGSWPDIDINGVADIRGRVIQRAGRRRKDRKSYL